MSIIGNDAGEAAIVLGSPTDPTGFMMKWNHDSNILFFRTSKSGAKIRMGGGDSANLLDITDTEINPKFRTSKFHTFITQIDFYNKDRQLLMTANLPQPLRKSKIKDMKIKVQMDY